MLKSRVGNDGGDQMILSTVVLYVLRKLNLIKFSDDSADGKTAVKHFVPVRVLRQISPLSIAYLLYMVPPEPNTVVVGLHIDFFVSSLVFLSKKQCTIILY
jgi:hypothetical protein